jgi:hypothetical protein
MMRTEPRCPRTLLKRAILLGLVAAVVASLLLWGGIILVGVVLGGGWSRTSHVDPYAVLIIVATATIVVSLFPGAIGGATNAYVLHWPSSRGKLTRVTSIVPDLLIGFLAGFATVLAIYLIAEVSVDADALYLAFQASCASAPMGGWHGWRVGKWLLEAQ